MSVNNLQYLNELGDPYESVMAKLLSEMTLEEKIGQMSQFSGNEGWVSDDLATAIRAGKVGSVLNEVNLDTATRHQGSNVSTHEYHFSAPAASSTVWQN